MQRILIQLILMVSFLFSSALRADQLSTILLKSLPKNLDQIFLQSLTKSEVINKIGKPDLIENNRFYYNHNEVKYSTEILFQNEKVSAVSYHYSQKVGLTFDSFKSELAKYKPSYGPKDGGDLMGSEMSYTLSNSLIATFETDNKKRLRSLKWIK